jgi:hypothetical protein
MKIQIDTTAKTLKLDEATQMGELIKSLELLFPNGEWREFNLMTNVNITWVQQPVIIKQYPVYPEVYPSWPWWNQPYYTSTGGISYELNPGIYDIQF